MSEGGKRPVWPWFLCGAAVGFVLMIVVLVIMVASLASDLVGVSEGGYERSVVEDEEDEQGVFVEIPVTGIIVDSAVNGTNPVWWVGQCLEDAAKEENLKGILVTVNSPGGGIRSSDVILHRFREFKAKHDVPIVVHMKDVAASGGYYVAMASDWIVAHEDTITASIGVIWAYMNWQVLTQEKLGVRFENLKSAPMKDIFSPDREMTPEERRLIQGFVDDAFAKFVGLVVEGRKGKGKVPVTEESVRGLDSTILSGRNAFEIGLVDELGFREDAISKLKELAGVKKADTVRYVPPKSLLEEMLSARAEDGPLSRTARRLEALYTEGPGLLALWVR